MNLNLKQLLDRRQELQRSQYYDRALATPAPAAATVAGFDADSGQVVLSVDGSEILADSLTSGAIETGTALQIQTARGSCKAAVDAMPA